MIQPTLINLHPNECSQEFYYYPFVLKLDRCVRCFNTVNEVSNRVCVPSKTEDLKLSMFNMITVINQSYVCKYKFDGKKCKNVIQINDWTTINIDVSVKSIMYVKKIWILLHVVVKMENI